MTAVFEADQVSGRKCGECNLCCKLVPVRADLYPRERVSNVLNEMMLRDLAKPSDLVMMPDFDKPAGKPCPHQRHRKGCNIYEKRPFSCRFWNCRWLVNADCNELRRPDRSRYVIDIVPDFVTLTNKETGDIIGNLEVVQVWCDPRKPDAWRDPELIKYIERRADEGIATMIRYDDKLAITVFAPAISNDGEWHEVHDGELRRQRQPDELIEGLAEARRAKEPSQC